MLLHAYGVGTVSSRKIEKPCDAVGISVAVGPPAGSVNPGAAVRCHPDRRCRRIASINLIDIREAWNCPELAHSPQGKAKVVLEAISGRTTIQAITADHSAPEANGTGHGDDRRIDQLLQAMAVQLGDQRPGRAAIQWRRQGGGARLSLGPGSSG